MSYQSMPAPGSDGASQPSYQQPYQAPQQPLYEPAPGGYQAFQPSSPAQPSSHYQAPPAPLGAASEGLLPPPAAVGFPASPAHFAPGSNFFIHLCCAWSTPWFMVGRVAHRLGLPNAWGLSACTLLCTAATFALLSVASDPVAALSGGQRVGLLIGALAAASGIFLITATLRFAFRAAHQLPGTFTEDLTQSTPWVLCLPCYAPPASSPQQCAFPFQLALMEGALAEAAVAGEAGGAASGVAKEGAMHPLPQRIPQQLRGGAPLAPGQPPRWSTDLFGCTCNQRCEGDVALCACSAAWGWWMQTRLMRRVGRTEGADFWKVALGFFCLEGLPDLWDLIAAAAQVGEAAADVLGVVARLPVVLINLWLRRLVRDRYGIPEGFLCEDALVSCFCYPCAIAQQDRELTLRGEAV